MASQPRLERIRGYNSAPVPGRRAGRALAVAHAPAASARRGRTGSEACRGAACVEIGAGSRAAKAGARAPQPIRSARTSPRGADRDRGDALSTGGNEGGGGEGGGDQRGGVESGDAGGGQGGGSEGTACLELSPAHARRATAQLASEAYWPRGGAGRGTHRELSGRLVVCFVLCTAQPAALMHACGGRLHGRGPSRMVGAHLRSSVQRAPRTCRGSGHAG